MKAGACACYSAPVLWQPLNPLNSHGSSRRSFLHTGVALAGGSVLRFTAPGLAALAQASCRRQQEGAAFHILSGDEARELEAIAARILPTTSTPGAREAGVIWFFDQTFGTFNAGNLAFVREGLKELQAAIPGGVRFSELNEAAQDAYLKTREDTPFFDLCRFMTLCGFFGMSQYGGNRGDIGWKLIGVEPHQHVYQSPFGYYDAEYLREHPDG
jgi:hypothetical protein